MDRSAPLTLSRAGRGRYGGFATDGFRARHAAAGGDGLDGALLERMAFDGAGQPLTTTFADYLLPTATSAPRIETLHRQSPSPSNPLGVKGDGEGGTIPAPAAIVSAVEDALAPFGVSITECPITPARIVELIGAYGRPRGASVPPGSECLVPSQELRSIVRHAGAQRGERPINLC